MFFSFEYLQTKIVLSTCVSVRSKTVASWGPLLLLLLLMYRIDAMLLFDCFQEIGICDSCRTRPLLKLILSLKLIQVYVRGCGGGMSMA